MERIAELLWILIVVIFGMSIFITSALVLVAKTIETYAKAALQFAKHGTVEHKLWN